MVAVCATDKTWGPRVPAGRGKQAGNKKNWKRGIGVKIERLLIKQTLVYFIRSYSDCTLLLRSHITTWNNDGSTLRLLILPLSLFCFHSLSPESKRVIFNKTKTETQRLECFFFSLKKKIKKKKFRDCSEIYPHGTGSVRHLSIRFSFIRLSICLFLLHVSMLPLHIRAKGKGQVIYNPTLHDQQLLITIPF